VGGMGTRDFDSECKFAAPSRMAGENSIHCSVVGIQIFRYIFFRKAVNSLSLFFLGSLENIFQGGGILGQFFWGYALSPQPPELGGPSWGAHVGLEV